MRYIYRLALLLAPLLFASSAFSQTTLVSGSATDASGQTWNNGTYSFFFVPAPGNPGPYRWNGAPFNTAQVISGVLNGAGIFVDAPVPSNTSITPGGSKWRLQVCPAATFPCSSFEMTVTSATQTANVVPPAIVINLTSPGPFTKAYSDSEIVSAVVAAQYYNLITQKERICQVVSGQTCTTWVNVGDGAGGAGINPSTTFASAYYASPTTISGVSAPTVNGSYLCGYNVSASVAVAPTCDQTGLSARSATGATDTILFTDNNSSVEYQGAVSVATSLPTPTTLTNPFFFAVLDNLTTGVGTGVTVTPTTFTINGAATLVITQNQRCLIQVDPALATNWLASCTGGSAAFPRLDQVLDPTADKAFAMGSHVLGFNFGVGTPDIGMVSIDSVNNNGAIALAVKTEENGDHVYPLAARFTTIAQPVFGINSGDIEGVRILSTKGGAGSADNVTTLILETAPGVNTTNATGLDIRDVSAATNNWAIKTGLGKVQFGTVSAGVSGSLIYNPSLSDLRVMGMDNNVMYEVLAGAGISGPPSVIENIFPGSSLVQGAGSFIETDGSLINLQSGDDGAGAGNTQAIKLHNDTCTSTNGSFCAAGVVRADVDASSGQNTHGTKQSLGYKFTTTNSVNNGSSTGVEMDSTCSGTPCTAHAIVIDNGDIGLSGAAGTSGQVLTSAGANAIPTWTTPTAVPVAVTNFPSNVGTDTKTSQVAAIGSTTLLTTGGSNAAYMAVVTLNCDTTSAAATVNVTLGWTDPGSQAQTQSLGSAIVCTALGSNSMGGFTFPFRAKASTTITYSTSIVNTPTYDISLVIYKVTSN